MARRAGGGDRDCGRSTGGGEEKGWSSVGADEDGERRRESTPSSGLQQAGSKPSSPSAPCLFLFPTRSLSCLQAARSLPAVTPSCHRHTSPCTSFQPAPCLHPPLPLPPSSSRVPSRSLPSPSSLVLAGREELARGDPQLPQAFYSVQSSTLWPGDRLKVTCDFNSSNKRVATSSGGTHNDEMCNMWVVEGGHRAERAKARGRRGAGSGAVLQGEGGERTLPSLRVGSATACCWARSPCYVTPLTNQPCFAPPPCLPYPLHAGMSCCLAGSPSSTCVGEAALEVWRGQARYPPAPASWRIPRPSSTPPTPRRRRSGKCHRWRWRRTVQCGGCTGERAGAGGRGVDESGGWGGVEVAAAAVAADGAVWGLCR